MAEPASEKEYLDKYNIHDFDVPLCTVDMAIFTVQEEQLKVLLVKRARHPQCGKWALPGGFIDQQQDRTLEDTAFRKLREKTGVRSPYLEQVATIGGAKRDPRGWSLTVLYFALLSIEGLTLVVDKASSEVTWVNYETAKTMRLAFDHQRLLKLSFERLHSKTLYTSLPIHLMGTQFTLPELQSVYEIILGTPLQKKSFRKRLLDADIVEETGDKITLVSKPAMLYRAKKGHHAHVFPRTLESVDT